MVSVDLSGEPVVESVIAAGITGVLGYGLSIAKQKFPERRRWSISDPSRLLIFVSSSVVTATGQYSRPATGIGQAKALAVMAPSLERAFKKVDLQEVRFPEECGGRDLERDVISLGGRKNNGVSSQLLDRFRESFGVDQVDNRFVVPGCEPFVPHLVDGSVSVDYGLVVACENPFAPSSRVIVLAGGHTYGTIAAARWFVESYRPSMFSRRAKSPTIAVVECAVKNNHALGVQEVWRFRR